MKKNQINTLKSGMLVGATLAYSVAVAGATTIVTNQLVNVDFDGTGGGGTAPTPSSLSDLTFQKLIFDPESSESLF